MAAGTGLAGSAVPWQLQVVQGSAGRLEEAVSASQGCSAVTELSCLRACGCAQSFPANAQKLLFLPSSCPLLLPTTSVWHISRTFSIRITHPLERNKHKKVSPASSAEMLRPKNSPRGRKIHPLHTTSHQRLQKPAKLRDSTRANGQYPAITSEQAGTVPEEHKPLVAAPSALAHRTCKEEVAAIGDPLGARTPAPVPQAQQEHLQVTPGPGGRRPLAPALFF